MKAAVKVLLLFLVVTAAVWSLPQVMRAQTTNRAALVVRHGSEDVRTACVAFDEPQISGFELLQRSGAELELDVQGMGALVCSIDDTGCPPNDCLCQCRGGGECVYWSYWHNRGGSWDYSQGGSSVYMLEPGAIEGWSWGPGAVNAAIPPPDLTFEDVCEPAAEDTPTSTPSPTNTQPPLLITPGSLGSQSTSAAATATAVPSTATSTATLPPTATLVPTGSPTVVRQGSNPALASSTPRPTEAAVATITPTVEAVVVESDGNAPQQVTAKPEARARNTVREVKGTEPAVGGSTPVAVAAAVEMGQEGAATPPVNTQKKAGPTAEATAPLQVVGAEVVPTFEVPGGEPNPSDSRNGQLLSAETIPYVAFLLIIAGLLGLIGFVSLRRRRGS